MTKKSSAIILLLLFLASSVNAQRYLSTYAQSVVFQLNKKVKKAKSQNTRLSLSPRFRRYHQISRQNNTYYLNALARVHPSNFSKTELSRYNIDINHRYKNFAFIQIPLQSLQYLDQIHSFSRITVEEPAKTYLDSARVNTNTNLVHAGKNLSQVYKGKGVITSVIDIGFDYTHPTFRTAGSDSLRISQVWERNGVNADPPENFEFGTELVGRSEILGSKTDSAGRMHGTHVAGISSGSGKGTSGRFTGIAPKSEIMLVNNFNKGTYSAVSYLLQEAKEKDKPIVINMSYGSLLGTHDGQGLLGKLLNQLSGPGKILVHSAGNSGSRLAHFDHQHTQTDTVARTLISFSGSNRGKTDLQIQSGDLNDYWVAISIYDQGDNWNMEGTTPYYKAHPDTAFLDTIYDDDDADPDSTNLVFSMKKDTLGNDSYKMRVSINNTDQDDDNKWLGISFWSKKATIDMWGSQIKTKTEFVDKGLGEDVKPGNTRQTIGSKSTIKSVISVAAYTTKIQFTSIDGNTYGINAQKGELADFSSKGPTVDGRIKPDISAPGQLITSSFSSFDSLGSTRKVDTTMYNQRKYSYGISQGTSMSAPVISGAIGLMLQANPELSPADIKEIFSKTARRNNRYAKSSLKKDIKWGYGKIDVHAAVEMALQYTDLEEPPVVSAFKLYPNFPNPFNPATTIAYTLRNSGNVKLTVYNSIGQKVKTLINQRQTSGRHSVRFRAENLSSGVYFYQLETANRMKTRKMTLIK